MSAPYPSESDLEPNNELTYAFTSRSLTFFEIEAFDNALFDINCALSLSDVTMKFKERIHLMSHKVSCLCRLRRYSKALSVISAIIQLVPCLPINNQIVSSLIEAKDQILERIETQTQESDEKQIENDFESIEGHLKNIETFRSTSIELFEAEGKGRHYKAIESIPKGTIVFVEKAISCLLFRDFFSTHCQNCLKNVGYKCWPCRNCSQVVFCDKECADNAYHHSYECGIIDVIQKLGPNHHILFRTVVLVGPQMAIELAKGTSKQLEAFQELDPNKVNFINFLQLIDHKDKYCIKTKIPSILRSIQLALILESFEEFKAEDRLTETYVKELSALLDELNYKTFVNIFGVYEQKNKYRGFRGSHIGNALMFDTSFFNHSCSPNTQWVFNGQHITVVTTEDIAADDEVSISYGPYSQTMSFVERQDFLQKRYFFQCECNDCITGAKTFQELKNCPVPVPVPFDS